MKILKPLLASAIFAVLTVYFTYVFRSNTALELFISSPFNMSTEGNIAYNLVFPTVMILLVGIYLKNFNSAFQRKCSLRAVFLMSILASYMKSVGSMLYYRGYADFGISLGTSIITLCFLATFVISLEVYIENKEHLHHLYGRFLFSILTILVLMLGAMIFVSFFTTSSFLVHLMGLTSFLIIFIPYYERKNIRKFLRNEEKEIIRTVHHRALT